MARHPPARVDVIQAPDGTFACIVHFLYSSSEYLQRASLGLLNEISVSQDGCLAIEKEGAVPKITDLVHSSNSKTGRFRFKKVSEDKEGLIEAPSFSNLQCLNPAPSGRPAETP